MKTGGRLFQRRLPATGNARSPRVDSRVCRILYISYRKMLGRATRGNKKMELLHDIMEGRDYGQLKDLISDISRWRQDSK